MNKIGLFIGAILLLAIAGCFLPIGDKSVIEKTVEKVGGVPFDVYHNLAIHGKLTTGGAYLDASTTLTSALTLTAAQVCNSSVITVNSVAVPGTILEPSLDITLPATTTLFTTCLKAPGDSTTFEFLNLSPTASTTTQIVAGTGMDLLEPGNSNIFNVEIGGGDRATITLYRPIAAFESNYDVVGKVIEWSVAD